MSLWWRTPCADRFELAIVLRKMAALGMAGVGGSGPTHGVILLSAGRYQWQVLYTLDAWGGEDDLAKRTRATVRHLDAVSPLGWDRLTGLADEWERPASPPVKAAPPEPMDDARELSRGLGRVCILDATAALDDVHGRLNAAFTALARSKHSSELWAKETCHALSEASRCAALVLTPPRTVPPSDEPAAHFRAGLAHWLPIAVAQCSDALTRLESERQREALAPGEPTTAPADEWVSSTELKDRCGLTPDQLRAMVRRGRLCSDKRGTNLRWYKRAEVRTVYPNETKDL